MLTCVQVEGGGLPAGRKKYAHPLIGPAFIEAVWSLLWSPWVIWRTKWIRSDSILMIRVENEYGSYGEDKSLSACHSGLMKKRCDGIHPIRWSHGDDVEKRNLGRMTCFVTEGFGQKQPTILTRMPNSLTRICGRNGLDIVELQDGCLVYPRKEPRDSKGARRFGRSWAGSSNLWYGGTNFSFMNGCSGRSICHRSLLRPMGLCSMSRAIRQKVLCHSSDGDLPLSEYSRNRLSRVFRQTLHWQPRPVFGESGQSGWVGDNLYPERWKGRGQTTRLHLLYGDGAKVGCGRRKDCASLMSQGSLQDYLDDRHVATQYQAEIGERSLLSKEESGYEFKNLARGAMDVSASNCIMIANTGHSLGVCGYISTFIGSSALDLQSQVASRFSRNGRRCSSFTVWFSDQTHLTLSRYDRIWKGDCLCQRPQLAAATGSGPTTSYGLMASQEAFDRLWDRKGR